MGVVASRMTAQIDKECQHSDEHTLIAAAHTAQEADSEVEPEDSAENQETPPQPRRQIDSDKEKDSSNVEEGQGERPYSSSKLKV
mmetsp:Transcript_7027/g.17574  ORF Transcript_7027/g.17574 Transcript_7027/m.17574 type:complete len:85 (+) Transcript_7027:215-469(+)|eukprot:CAMPEP_0182826620 /NCGR_PEP_ID=MMETSP0006_2-20121128/16472_1 /TAXON_ID=97485 /ORGANISM="Prymnesium parvum, Strain Texoma1" /LENGTH=84 /DNA_ID=CAMNT_0024953799 /DNA_START=177 /DNA_END=431 /DNA_ORIENTATION=+